MDGLFVCLAVPGTVLVIVIRVIIVFFFWCVTLSCCLDENLNTTIIIERVIYDDRKSVAKIWFNHAHKKPRMVQ